MILDVTNTTNLIEIWCNSVHKTIKFDFYRSSEEEITATTGIEKGFESWNNRESDDDEEETIEEKGIDPSEHVDFNVVPILQDMDESDEYVKPEDYLKKESFLAEEEGATAVR